MRQKRKIQGVDNIHSGEKRNPERVDLAYFQRNKKQASSVLLSKGKITDTFFTEDSKFYLSPRQQSLIEQGAVLNDQQRQWDCISHRIVSNYLRERRSSEGMLVASLQKKLDGLGLELQDLSDNFFRQFSLVRLWNMSIVGAILLGMFSMTFFYKYLGQGAAAQENVASGVATARNERMIANAFEGKLMLGGDNQEYLESEEDASLSGINQEEERNIKALADMEDEMFREKAQKMVEGYPIEKMLPYILEKDRKVAAFMIGIAKKESAWGQHVPVLDGQDCFNYWGYRGQRKLMGTGGHTCFNSRKDAVDTVSRRIATLVHEKGKDTPEKMILWKCGSTCSGTPEEKKWVSDVNMYFKKLDS